MIDISTSVSFCTERFRGSSIILEVLGIASCCFLVAVLLRNNLVGASIFVSFRLNTDSVVSKCFIQGSGGFYRFCVFEFHFFFSSFRRRTRMSDFSQGRLVRTNAILSSPKATLLGILRAHSFVFLADLWQSTENSAQLCSGSTLLHFQHQELKVCRLVRARRCASALT
jgi:hypothetical protein